MKIRTLAFIALFVIMLGFALFGTAQAQSKSRAPDFSNPALTVIDTDYRLYCDKGCPNLREAVRASFALNRNYARAPRDSDDPHLVFVDRDTHRAFYCLAEQDVCDRVASDLARAGWIKPITKKK
jgi:hypothetical protein